MSSQANKLNNIKMALHVKSTVYNDVKKTNKLKIAKNTKTDANRYGGKITRTLFSEGGT